MKPPVQYVGGFSGDVCLVSNRAGTCWWFYWEYVFVWFHTHVVSCCEHSVDSTANMFGGISLSLLIISSCISLDLMY